MGDRVQTPDEMRTPNETNTPNEAKTSQKRGTHIVGPLAQTQMPLGMHTPEGNSEFGWE